MREIRFRARHKKDGKIDFYIDFNGILQDGFTAYPEDYILEQYIGIKDKNGLRIYEGDHVDIQGTNIDGVVVYDEDGARYLIEIDGGEAYEVFAYNSNDLEVINASHEDVTPCDTK